MNKHCLLLTFIFLIPLWIGAQQTEKPNILWLTSEDNSADWLGCYGNPHSNSPNIDKLAQDGFQYMNAFANAPVCAPSRSTWITGIMAVSMGTQHMRSYYPIPHHKIKYYPDYLRAEGYHCANYKKKDYNIGGRKNASWDNDSILNWESLKNSQPFFQVINMGESHESRAFGDVYNTQHDPKKTRLRKYHPDVPGMRENYAHYHDAIHKMDAKVGNMLAKLDEMGMTENTIVVYVSDHGGVLPRSKRFLFANSLHCPLVVRIPKQFKELWPANKPGTKIDRLVSFVDMPKTWVSLAGGTPPEYMQGKVFLGPQAEPEAPFHMAFRGRMDERVDNARALCDDRYLYIRNYMPYVPWMQHLDYLWTMEATKAWEKAIGDGKASEIQARFFSPKVWTEELYDMQKDPDCTANLIDNPEVENMAVKMRKHLRKKQMEIYDAGLLPESEMVRLANENNTTIYEMVRNPGLYHVEAILDAADLALEKDRANLPELRKLLENPNLGLRYWGMIGCFLLDDQPAGLKMINDESHEVRAMAAWTLIKTGKKEKGIQCITDMINERSYAMLTLMNMVEWIGEDGKALMPAVKAINLTEKYAKQYKYPIRMRNHLYTLFGE
ncbi:sulfatase-like hydrolase/transferase [Saccharicrinis sp. 156]|uniref:sulfatase-like hydrolase/transferase n=1 Tax=Saccharicrinis sp. 156 TaxID=3417574 RepID=UPI003D3539E5